MKKNILTLIIAIGLSVIGHSQVNPHAIGLRGGNGNLGYGGEISYQHGIGSSNRLEIDLGWKRRNYSSYHYSHSTLTGVYHWVWNLTEGLNWYAGPGVQLGSYNDNWNSANNGLTVSIGGQLGIEYDFNNNELPILFSLDVRPMWGLTGGTTGAGYGYAFGLRYTF